MLERGSIDPSFKVQVRLFLLSSREKEGAASAPITMKKLREN
jgi:hypothetical protein